MHLGKKPVTKRQVSFVMTKKEYSEQLKTQEWRDKRFKIMKRDGFKCCKCGSTKDLQVHHKKYLPDKAAWEAPNSLLQTLCRVCHIEVHKNRPIQSFIKKKAVKKDTRTHNERRIDRLKGELSERDFKIQIRYDKIKNAAKTKS